MALSPFGVASGVRFVPGAGATGSGVTVVCATASVTGAVTGAAVAGSLATGVDTLGAEVPAGLKYWPYFSRS